MISAVLVRVDFLQIKSLADKSSGEAQLGIHIALALASGQESSMLGFVASPHEIKVFCGEKKAREIHITKVAEFEHTQLTMIILNFLEFLYNYVHTDR